MLTGIIQANSIAGFLGIVYLLLVNCSGHTYFWCKADESKSHLESNLSGSCWMPCETEPEGLRPGEQAFNACVVAAGSGECIDSPLFSSGITPSNQKSPKSRAAAVAVYSADISASVLIKHSNFAKPPFARQLPPRQAMASLRAVSLLC